MLLFCWLTDRPHHSPAASSPLDVLAVPFFLGAPQLARPRQPERIRGLRRNRKLPTRHRCRPSWSPKVTSGPGDASHAGCVVPRPCKSLYAYMYLHPHITRLAPSNLERTAFDSSLTVVTAHRWPVQIDRIPPMNTPKAQRLPSPSAPDARTSREKKNI